MTCHPGTGHADFHFLGLAAAPSDSWEALPAVTLNCPGVLLLPVEHRRQTGEGSVMVPGEIL